MAFSRFSDLAKAMGNEIVTLYVGPERKRYVIHKALLTRESDYFDKALNGAFKEAEAQSIDLPEESPAAVNLLVGWLYQDRILVVGSAAGQFVTHSNDATPTQRQNSIFQSTGAFGGYSTTGPFGGLSSPQQIEMRNTVYPENNEGTGLVPYHSTMEPTIVAGPGFVQTGPLGPWNETYENISAQQEYRTWSPEELRLADYHVGRIDSTIQTPPGGSTPFPLARPSITPSTSASLPCSNHSTITFRAAPVFTTTNATVFGPQKRIPGIPTCPSLQDLTIQEEEHQLAVLKLCLLAETLCWPFLFNRAMSAYVSGESNLSHRSTPTNHISLVYDRAHDTSPCRSYISDAAVFHIRDLDTHDQFMELMADYPAFLKDFLQSMAGTAKAAPEAMRNPNSMERCVYHVHAKGEKCEKDFEMWPAIKGEVPKEFGQGRTHHTQVRSWYESREHGESSTSTGWSSPSRSHERYVDDD